MAWEHSYTPEAYDIARQELETWTAGDLAAALADYNYGKFHGDPPWRKGNPHRRGHWTADKILREHTWAVENGKIVNYSYLIDSCMDAIMDVYTCDNGAWAMWIDFDGYHKVPLPKGE